MVPCLEERCQPVVECLARSGVRFLAVGGWAVRFHGRTGRDVGDLDLLVDFSEENWPGFVKALQDIRMPVKAFNELANGPRPHQMKLEPLDLLTGIGAFFSEAQSCTWPTGSGKRPAIASLHGAVSFREAWLDSVEAEFGKQCIPVRVLSRAHLILSKQDSNREQDLEDMAFLTRF